MRLLWAIIVLLLSIVSLGMGIAMRTVLAGPDTLVKTVEIDHTAPVILISGDTLTAYPGRQTVTVLGDSGTENSGIVVAYGRTKDVLGWVRPARFTAVLHDDAIGTLYAAPRLGPDSRVPEPLGSDLWLEQFRDDDALKVSLTADAGITVAVFADGDRAAPGTIQLSWPLDNVSPVAGLLVAGGLLAMVGGFVLLLLALADIRRSRGPRRKTPVAPKRRAPSRRRIRRTTPAAPARGRRRVNPMSALALGLTVVTLASACVGTPDSTAEEESSNGDGVVEPVPATPYPAVTQAQFSLIMERIATQVSLADQDLDGALLEERMDDPAGVMRAAQYTLRSFDEQLGQLVPIPSSPIRLLVPQQTSTWPRIVFAVIQEGPESNAPSVGIVLEQKSARENYRLIYSVLLAPDVVLPPMPSSEVGSPRLSRDSKLLAITPDDTVEGYAEILVEGENSPLWSSFDVLTDNLFTLVGPEGQALRTESLGRELELDLSIEASDYPVVALATSDSGALVFGTLSEIEEVRPVEQGASINATPSVRALTGEPQSTEGFVARYDMHLVWYVPPIGSDERARVVGYSYALVDAKEIDAREVDAR